MSPYRLVFLLLALALAAGFVRLGIWQLDRAAEKEAILADFDRGVDAAPTNLPRYHELPRFSAVRIDGRFLAAPFVLLDNQVREGEQGLMLIQPFRPEGGGPDLLVNRGWIAQGPDRETPAVEARTDRIALTGYLADPPRPGIRLGEVEISADAAPQRVPWFDPTAVAAALNSSLAPQILLSTDDGDAGLVKSWRPQMMPADKHRAYAFQWFLLAIAVMIVWVVMHRRATRRPG